MKHSTGKHVANAAIVAAILLSHIAVAQERTVEYVNTPLSETVSMLKGSGGNIGVSAGADGVFLVDDQFADLAPQLIAEIGKLHDGPIRFVINTHYHGDHTGGNEALAGLGAIVIAHDNIHKRMSQDQFTHFFNSTTEAAATAAWPVITFSETTTLHLNGEKTVVHHVPRGHTDGDAIVHFTGSNVIHMGDIYFRGLYPFIDLDGGGTLQGMIAAVDIGLKLANDETQIIPGHGPLSRKSDLQEYRDFLAAARDRVQAQIDQGKSLDETIASKPTAEWDEAVGNVWITPAQFVTFIYNSLTGVDHFTRTPLNSTESE